MGIIPSTHLLSAESPSSRPNAISIVHVVDHAEEKSGLGSEQCGEVVKQWSKPCSILRDSFDMSISPIPRVQGMGPHAETSNHVINNVDHVCVQ